MYLLVGGIDSGWVGAWATAALVVGGGFSWVWLRWRDRRKIQFTVAVQEAQEPALKITAEANAAEAISRAAAALLAPFQQAVTDLTGQNGQLREAVRAVREREADCQKALADMRTELATTNDQLTHCTRKLREVTDRLGMDPNGQ